jgi:lipopolysaccharide/colanic/teichoic acid biosynthesis glycosyltransferase
MTKKNLVPRTLREASANSDLLEELYDRYGKSHGLTSFRHRFRLWRKKKAWTAVVSGARILKRLIDILASAWLMVALSPIFLIIAASIKLTDNGPVLYWQTRVGKWGQEFRFPKFRSMRVTADREGRPCSGRATTRTASRSR